MHQLGPIIESTEELRAVRRRYLAEMAEILRETLRRLGSTWPDDALTNAVTLLIEISTTTYHHIGRCDEALAKETLELWHVGAKAILQRCMEGGPGGA